MRKKISKMRIANLRKELCHGDITTPERLKSIVRELTPHHKQLRPKDKVELLPLFNRKGKPNGKKAPRWICHTLGLRHRCAHILVIWPSPAASDMLVLQVRDWSKDDSPGELDISVGGHDKNTVATCADEAAFIEMLEELGISPGDLESKRLKYVGGYRFYEERPKKGFYNAEWRDVFIARLKSRAIDKVHFPDGEVAALVLVPIKQAKRLLEQTKVPMASALRRSLPRCL
ncbi:MAG: hypothetical protein NTW03_16445 [Verrucomicrobia bacterium]|nr:hypothetical protein [Verrucomicrobiota bacterium]